MFQPHWKPYAPLAVITPVTIREAEPDIPSPATTGTTTLQALHTHAVPLHTLLADNAGALPRLLSGPELARVEALAASIDSHGLLSPLLVSVRAGRHVVVDGRKRLLALRQLAFAGRLGRLGEGVPFVEVDDSVSLEPGLGCLAPAERADAVAALRRDGLAEGAIAARLDVAAEVVEGLLSLERVSDRIRNLFFSGHLSETQVGAFATLGGPAAQNRLLDRLGPFVDAPDILEAIQAGERVLHLGDSEDDAVILPSAAPEPAAARLQRVPEFELAA